MDDKQIDGSKLLYWLNKLNIVSKESTNSGEEFDSFNQYMHVERQIQTDLLSVLKERNGIVGNLIFLAGSSGDGKSHLFSYLRENYSDLVDGYDFYRDATESDDLDLDAEEVLEKKLVDFSDDGLERGCSKKMIIAINLGIMSNFIAMSSVQDKYSKLVSFIKESEVLEEGNIKRVYSNKTFSIVNFSGYNDLELIDGKLVSPYIEKLFEKIFSKHEDNIFYNAYLEDKSAGLIRDYLVNYELMLNKEINKSVIELLIMAKLNKNLIIPTRMIFNFIYKIIVPSDELKEKKNLKSYLQNSLPELIFSNIPQNKLSKPLQELDVLKVRLPEMDTVISELFVISMSDICDEYFSEKEYELFVSCLKQLEGKSKTNDNELKALYIRVVARLVWLGKKIKLNKYYETYNAFIVFLDGYNSADINRIQELIDFVHNAVYLWIGDGKSTYIRSQTTTNIYLSYQVEIEDAFEELPHKEDNASIFTTMKIPFKESDADMKADIEVDFGLFELLYAINKGYRPNSQDEENAISFIKFMNLLAKSGQNKMELVLGKDANAMRYVLKKKKKLGQDVYEFGRKN